MTVYPAIDLKAGQCVRLLQGDMNKATVYGEDPAAMARSFVEQGAQWLHVVDLDGAFAGESLNAGAVAAIVKAAGVPVQLGGGMRSMEQLARAFGELGVSRIILGTAALESPELVAQAVSRYGEGKIAVGIDAKNGNVAVRGWVHTSAVSALELAKKVKSVGVRTIIYTDISRDGMLSGPNFEAAEALIRESGLNLIVSGGVASLEHIAKARQIGAAGVIAGKALYTGAITLADAVAEGGKPC